MNDVDLIWECYLNILKESDDTDELTEELKNSFRDVSLNGEYWDMDGHIQYADGDIGDFNHEAIAINHAFGMICGMVGFNIDNEYSNIDDLLEYLTDEYNWDSEETKEKFIELLDNHEKEQAILLVIGDTPENSELLDVALDNGDARKYAIEKWDWIAIRGNSIEMKHLTRDNLIGLHGVITEIMNIEDFDYKIKEHLEDLLKNDEYFEPLKSMDMNNLLEYIENEIITFGVSTYTGKSYEVTLKDLKTGNVSGLAHDPNKTKGKLIIHPDLHKDVHSDIDYYKHKPIGDSVEYK